MTDRSSLCSGGELACLAELWPAIQRRWRLSVGKKRESWPLREVDRWKAWVQAENEDRQIKKMKGNRLHNHDIWRSALYKNKTKQNIDRIKILLWSSHTKSFSCKGELELYFWQTSKFDRAVFLSTGECYINSEVKTQPNTDWALWLGQAFSPHVAHYRTHAHNNNTDTTRPSWDISHVLTTTKFTWHWSVWSSPRKANRSHKRAGAFVFVECHTSSRGKPVTGPGRPLKPGEGRVRIASVATSDVNSNIGIVGYFRD